MRCATASGRLRVFPSRPMSRSPPMLGPVKPRRLDESIAVSLEDLVPASNFYRHLEAKLDLSFVRDWTQELYAVRGRPSIDPVVFFKLQLGRVRKLGDGVGFPAWKRVI